MSSISTLSQCTYRCVVLPDTAAEALWVSDVESQCTYRCVVLPDGRMRDPGDQPCGLNAPTGAWCSLTLVVAFAVYLVIVSMHLQVRGAP